MLLLSTKFTFFFACTILLFLHTTQAFCIYNFVDEETTREIRISNIEETKKSFAKRLRSGQSTCCHWSNRECNPEGLQDSVLPLRVQSGFGRNFKLDDPVAIIHCQAGGSIAFRGSNFNDFRVVCTQLDGTDEFSYIKDCIV